MEGVELRHLRYFVAVAESLHFRRAAERLHVSQPSVSEQIANLERSLGHRLFQRSPRGVQLTASGEVFLVEAREVLARMEVAVRRARSAAVVGRPVMRVSFSEWANTTCVAVVLRAFRQRHPEVTLDPYELSSLASVEAIIRGEIDLGFIWYAGETSLQFETVARERFVVAAPEHAPIAERDEPVSLSALASERYLWPGRQFNPPAYDYLLKCCRAAGFTPQIVGNAAPRIYSYSTTMELVAAENLIAFVLESRTQQPAPPGIVLRALADPAPFADISAAWRADNTSTPLKDFLAIVHERRPRQRVGELGL